MEVAHVHKYDQLACAYCGNDYEFELPEGIERACQDGKLVIFAGAGISTENHAVVHTGLRSQVAAELALGKDDDRSFPQVMSAYERFFGRQGLIRRIKKHLDYVKSFPNLNRAAGEFHRELSSLFMVTDIFTTNWDNYFEVECGAQPFITEEDWALWEPGVRSVFKLHGSLSNPGSIVATEEDYQDCYVSLNERLIGAQLKLMLATKTIVFIGYSLTDEDFVRLYEALRHRMGKLMPIAYIVTIDEGEPPAVAREMQVIRTSGLKFVKELKARMRSEHLLDDERFDAIPATREFVRDLHHEAIENGTMSTDPALLMCACYQDGLMDAFDHQMANRSRGPYYHRCYVEDLIRLYEGYIDSNFQSGKFESVAYIEGYVSGLLFLIADDDVRAGMPLYFVFGYEGEKELRSYEDFLGAQDRFGESEPEIYEYAKQFVDRLGPDMVFQHRPVI